MGELSHLDELEAEAIYIIREVAAECEKPVMLYSIGKDSSVMLHLAMKAFYPEKPPFPFLHVNTTWKFHEMIEFRDRIAKEKGIEMLEYINQDGVKQGINPFDHGSAYTDIMKTQALKQALDKYGFTAAFGGGRRDEEKSRAKERIFSFRNENHAWDPKNQRPEMWKLYNSRIKKGQEVRVFPLSNWTEKDIWQYIKRENIEIPSLYFAKERPVVYRDGNIIMVDDDRMKLRPGEKIQMKSVRFRTLGCYPLTGGVESTADTLDEIIDETLSAVSSERTTRVIDNEAAGSMERSAKEGDFVQTKNPVIDALLMSKRAIASKEMIQVKMTANLTAELLIRDYDLTIMLGNLYDNAVDACRRIEKDSRWIRIQLVSTLSDFMVVFKNPVAKNQSENRDWKSTKSDGNLHGYGIKNIDKTVAL